MSIIPSGDKFKPKAEKIPVSKAESDAEVLATTIIGGIAIAKLGNLPLMGYGIATLGFISVINEFRRLGDPWRKVFAKINLQIDGVTPIRKQKRKTDYGHCLTFSLPTGLSTDDFEKNKLAIEQHLNKKIDINYKNHRVFIRVYEKELEKAPKYQFIETKKPLEFAIGIKYGGEIVTVDLEKSLHLLVAGQTGGGKSTFLRAVITNLILSNKYIALHLIDLKGGAEFGLFRKCAMVESFSRLKNEVEESLLKITQKMNQRYDLFYESDVVDIKDYNKKYRRKKLKYHAVIVDEHADLQYERESTAMIEEIARKGRAAGIFLIACTQRPSAKILEGDSKANFPTVIGFKTLNDLNSRIIIGENGLEKLRGMGHGLLQSEGELLEFQTMNLQPDEARKLVQHTFVEKEAKEIPRNEKHNKPVAITGQISDKKSWNDIKESFIWDD